MTLESERDTNPPPLDSIFASQHRFIDQSQSLKSQELMAAFIPAGELGRRCCPQMSPAERATDDAQFIT